MSRYPEHLRGFDYRGFHRYFLTFCTYGRTRHFTAEGVVSLVCDHFLRAATEEAIDVIAYCFMPDHVHLVVSGAREDTDLRLFIKRAKQYSGFYFKQRTGRRLWQRYGFERILRNEEATCDVVRYTLANPVRAGLVSAPGDYPYWGSFVCSREELLVFASRAA